MSRIQKDGGKLSISGYTIVEALMFLAISGAMVGSVMAMVSGEQNKTEFITAVRNLESEVQDVINDVSIGYYPSNNAFSCSVNVSGVPTITGGSSAQGTNQDCIFAGKALQFSPAGANTQGRMEVYTIMGRRQIGSGSSAVDVRNIEESHPRVVSNIAGLSNSYNLNSSLRFDAVLVGATPRGGFAIVPSFGQTNATGGGVVTGSSGSSIMGLDVDINRNFGDLQTAVNGLAGVNATTQTITICISETGIGRQRAAVQLTGRGTEILFGTDSPAGCP